MLVRPLELKNKDGVLIMDATENKNFIKDGISYVDFMVNKMNESQYKKWLDERKKENLDEKCLRDIRNAVFTESFAYMQRDVNHFIAAISLVVDLLLQANDMWEIKTIRDE